MVDYSNPMYSSVFFKARNQRISENEKKVSFCFPLVENRDSEKLKEIGSVGKSIIEALNTLSDHLHQATIEPTLLYVCYRGTIEDARDRILQALEYTHHS